MRLVLIRQHCLTTLEVYGSLMSVCTRVRVRNVTEYVTSVSSNMSAVI